MSIKSYYNEIDPFCVQWLKNLMKKGLITQGDIDGRSILEVKGEDLRGYDRVHMFAGIGGWDLALNLAGWEDERAVWTGSCPCQPFSSIGKQKGGKDDRHLWPEWFRLMRQSRPTIVFGEQVASAIGHGWLDLVSTDLEGEGYACGSAVLGAHSVGAPHIRQRLWFVANLSEQRLEERFGKENIQSQEFQRPERLCSSEFVAHRCGERCEEKRTGSIRSEERPSWEGPAGSVGYRHFEGLEGYAGNGNGGKESAWRKTDETGPAPATGSSFWADRVWIECRDGKARCAESVPVPMADGLPRGLGLVRDGDRVIIHPLVKETKNRARRLEGYGNAIVPQVGAEFIKAFLQTER